LDTTIKTYWNIKGKNTLEKNRKAWQKKQEFVFRTQEQKENLHIYEKRGKKGEIFSHKKRAPP